MNSTIRVPKSKKYQLTNSQQSQDDILVEESTLLGSVPQPVIVQEIKSYRIKRSTAAHLLNDIIYLNKIKISEPNVHFRFGNGFEISMHSFILIARSDWFRRCWRNRNNNNNNDDIANQEYNFNIKSDFHLDIEINLDNSVPYLLNGEFNFSVNKTRNLNQVSLKLIYNSFKQFKEYLYRETCEINEENSFFLMSLALAFELNAFKSCICNYLIDSIDERNLEGILKRLELAHVYELDNLKSICIKTVNDLNIQIINSVNWPKFANAYPELVIDIFRKNIE